MRVHADFMPVQQARAALIGHQQKSPGIVRGFRVEKR
jgi:hypothetical protein